MAKVEVVITAQEKDLGGFSVRRILPYAHCMVGPFIFFDHMGPAVFTEGNGIDVRPHPHIALATLTYLFEGKIRHRDSLGSDQLIEPGAINWMVAGKGIVHSERTPQALRQSGSRLNGIQCWVALPNEAENIAPSFKHYPADQIPEFKIDNVTVKLLVGNLFNHSSPVKVDSEMFYIHAQIPKGGRLHLPVAEQQSAAYVVSGKVLVNDQEVDHCAMAVAGKGLDLIVEAIEDSHVMFLGGKPVGQRYIYWNFVASSKEAIDEAMQDWSVGPGDVNSRFPKVPGDDVEYIPLPERHGDLNPKGTVM